MSVFDQRGQRVDTQYNVAGDLIQPGPAPRLPLQRPPRAVHFTGREEELAQLLTDLQPGRVVTLCGPGGVGKTALAAEAIWILAPGDEPPTRFPDGILFHSFYTQPQADLALEAIARAYGEEPRPSPRDAARRVLAGGRALLVLDGAENADDLGVVLEIAGGCGVLATSRRRGDATDHAGRCDVAPLPNPEAVQLLQAWGGDRAADEDAVRRICNLVGGLPLAVRLAGRYLAQREEEAADYLAWLAETPLTALDHGQRQHESVPLLLERSLAQVSEGARGALAVVGILALAPFGREAVAAALDASATEAGRRLGELVDYGLLLRSEGRYQASHALVHTYARRRLSVSVEALERLVTYYDAWVREQSREDVEGFRRLDIERVHVMHLQAGCVEREEWEAARRLAWALDDYLFVGSYSTEWLQVANAALTAARGLGNRRDEGEFLNKIGLACSDLGQVTQAITSYEQALEIAREINHRQDEGITVGNLGNAYSALGQVARAIEYYQQALAIHREIGDRRGEGADLGNLGLAYSDMGQVERAIEYYQQALAIAREIGDRPVEGNALGNLGNAYSDIGQVARAIEYYQQALAIHREIGDRRGEGAELGGLGNAYRALGQVERAIEYYQQALAIAREIGDRRGEGNRLGNLGNAYSTLGRVERAIDYYRQALAIAREIGDRRNEGTWLGSLGNAYAELGEPRRAIEYHEQALVIAHEIGDRRNGGTWLGNLGRAYADLGQGALARDYLGQALAIFEEIQSPDAERVRTWLAELEEDE